MPPSSIAGVSADGEATVGEAAKWRDEVCIEGVPSSSTAVRNSDEEYSSSPNTSNVAAAFTPGEAGAAAGSTFFTFFFFFTGTDAHRSERLDGMVASECTSGCRGKQ